jgi:hypothetical protein
MKQTPTHKTYTGLHNAFAYFNKRLFADRLPHCLITVRPHQGEYGYFSPERFSSRDGRDITERNRAQRQALQAAITARDPINAGARDGAPRTKALRQAITQWISQ